MDGAHLYLLRKESMKRYGKTDLDYPEPLDYPEERVGNTMYIISYELFRYKTLNHLPLPEDDTIRSIAAAGAGLYPKYFGNNPVPFLTPWGCTNRNKIIANGLFWLKAERCQRRLALACPQYDDLSDGARGLAVPFDNASTNTNDPMPEYLFFKEADSSVPLFELILPFSNAQLNCNIDRAALMNAIYQSHPEYVTQYNITEQAGAEFIDF